MILDTNAYTALARSNPAITELVSSRHELILPLQVIAELRYGFAKGTRTAQNERNLQRFLAQSQVSVIKPSLKTTNHYAQLQLLCQQRGRALSHNDIWIAALALETGDTLATFDRDFSVFQNVFGEQLVILC